MTVEFPIASFIAIVVIAISVLVVTIVGCIQYRLALIEEKKLKKCKSTNGICIWEISIEELSKQLDDSLFIEMVENYCSNNYVSSNAVKSVSDGIVQVRIPCGGRQNICIAFPDRLDEVGCDGESCKSYINLNKLCGVEYQPKDYKNILTDEEVELFTKLYTKLVKE